jgi:hypothetical protein
LAWSRFRVIFALGDRTLPSVVAALDRTFRIIGGAPTYALTDNEKTVTDRHVARLPVRNRRMVSAGTYYGVSIRSCEPADPESKGGAETTVRIAKAAWSPPTPTCGASTRHGLSWSSPARRPWTASTPGPMRSPAGHQPRCSKRSARTVSDQRNSRSAITGFRVGWPGFLAGG